MREDFQEASRRLRRLLSELGEADEIAWLFVDTCICCRDGSRLQWFVHGLGDDKRDAEELYVAYSARGYGIVVTAHCKVGSRVGAYLWAPDSEDEAEAENVMGLKLSVGSPLFSAIAVPSMDTWAKLRARAVAPEELAALPLPRRPSRRPRG